MNRNRKTKLIVLSGTSNSGKTNTLKLLISQILSMYRVNQDQFVSVIDYNVAKSWKDTDIQSMINDNSDWLVFLKDVNGKSIAIHTAGDTGNQVEHSLSYIDKYDFVIFATKAIKYLDTGSVGTIQSYLHNNKDLAYFPIYKLQYDSVTDTDKISDDYRVSQSLLSVLDQLL